MDGFSPSGGPFRVVPRSSLGRTLHAVWLEPDQHLSGVGAVEQVEERLWRVAQPLCNGLLVPQLAVLDQRRDLGEERLSQIGVVADEEPADGEPLLQDL